MKRCRECGEVTTSSGNVCLSCGGKLHEMSMEEKKSYIQKEDEQREVIVKKQSRKRTIELTICALLTLIGLGLFVTIIVQGRFEFFLLVFVVLIVISVLQAINPDFMWDIEHSLSFIAYDNLTPTDFHMRMYKLRGFVFLALADIIFAVYLFVG
ncbi:hypothetical protein [Anaerosporobacter sp.]|uniref:hypothetical protein n=1 Tax=Anaerosporobacter sp. TaxID=1872529 RepID=UPI00286F18BA|nr:hypothetical protein [Anaerosporobacter sp.]